MTTLMPTALDAFVNPAATDLLSSATVPHAAQHDTLNDAMAAVEKMAVGPAVYNVKGYGALGNAQVITDGAITAAAATLTSASGLFVAGDVGKRITVLGAGAAGAQLSTTISAYTSATTVTLAATAGTTVSGARVVWGTGDYTAFNSVITALSAAGGGVMLVPPGAYALEAGLIIPSNVWVRGSGHGVATLYAVGTATALLSANTTLTSVKVSDLTLDANNQASCILFLQGGNDKVHIDACHCLNTVQNAAVSGPGGNLGWCVGIGSASLAASTNIFLTNTIVGPNKPYYEAAIFLNCTDVIIAHNIFRQAGGTAAATGLAIYAYCRNVVIAGNTFDTNAGTATTGGDCYIQQSDTVTYTANTHYRTAAGTALGLFNVHDVVVSACSFNDSAVTSNGINIDDQLDQGLTAFNGNASRYAYSAVIKIIGCAFSGIRLPVQIYSNPMTSTQVSVNNQTDIIVQANVFDNIGIYGVQIGGANAQNIQRIHVLDNIVTGGSYSGGGGVIVIGNPGFSATATTQAITASAAKQTVTLASTTGIVAGTWIHLDAGTPAVTEEVYVYSIPVAGSISAIFAHNHATGAAVAQSTTLVSTSGSNGISDVMIARNTMQRTTSGNSSGIIVWNTNALRLLDNNLRNAQLGTGAIVSLIGTGAYQYASRNLGYNPVIAPTAPIASPVTATWYQNTTGVDCYVQVKQTTVTGTHLYVNSTNSTTGALDYGAATAWPGTVFVPAGAYIQFVFSAGTVALVWQGN